jgi:hypothetical protein
MLSIDLLIIGEEALCLTLKHRPDPIISQTPIKLRLIRVSCVITHSIRNIVQVGIKQRSLPNGLYGCQLAENGT